MISLLNGKNLRILITTIVVMVAVVFNITNSLHKRTIGGDAQGYYAWLPVTLIHHHITFESWADSLAAETGFTYPPHYLNREGEVLINKYTLGSALLMSPFFLAGHAVAWIGGYETNGFSIPYVLFTSLAGIFFCVVGLWFIYKISLSYGASRGLSFLAALVLGWGTNLFHYAVMQPAMSHVYSFSAVAALVWLLRRELSHAGKGNLWKAALALGFIVAIRPVNGLVVLAIPFLLNSPADLPVLFKKAIQPTQVWKIVAAATVLPLLMMVVWEFQTGYKIFYGYKGEGFQWDSPHFLAMLFSYRKGWFVYTPLALTILPALVHLLLKRDLYRFTTFVLFMMVLLYVLSSWWSWWYGDGFGMRPLVDFYPIVIIPVIIWLSNINSEKLKGALITVVVLLTGFNLLQTWQYNAGILLPDNMSSKKYWHVFCKTSTINYTGSIGLQSEDLFRGLQRDTLLNIRNDFERAAYRWAPWPRRMVHDSAFSGSWVLAYDRVQTYSMSIGIDSAKLFRTARNLLIDGTFWYLELEPDAVLKSPLVIDIQAPGGVSTFYKGASLKEIPDSTTGMWRKASFRFTAPVPDSGSELKIYLWNKYNKKFYVDDFDATIFSLKY